MIMFHKKSKFSSFHLTGYLCIRMHFCLTFPSPQMFTPSCEGFFTSLGPRILLSGHRDLGRENIGKFQKILQFPESSGS